MFNPRCSFAYLAAGALIMGLVSCGDQSQPGMTAPPQEAGSTPSTVTVNIAQGATGQGPAAFGTNPLVINAGDSVQWVNSDSVAHTATSDTGDFDTGMIQPGATSSPVPFQSPGSFPYHCAIHGAASMSGTIQVTGASPGPSASPSGNPSAGPSANPSQGPSSAPITLPSVSPSAFPSSIPSAFPTGQPTVSPTETATPVPTSTSVKQFPSDSGYGY